MNNIRYGDFISFTPSGNLMVGTTGVYHNNLNIPVGNDPVITIQANLTNFVDGVPYSGYIDFNIVVVSGGSTVLTTNVRITYMGNVPTLGILTPVPGANIDLNQQNNILTITTENLVIGLNLYPTGFSAQVYYVQHIQLGGIATAFLFPPSNTTEVRVPIIDIMGQTTLNGDYLSDMTFVVQDKYKYKCSENIVKKCKNGCVEHYYLYGKLKTTTFQENNIPLQCVVKGKGKTLRAKVKAIYPGLSDPDFQDFYRRFILYGMLKYFLIRLIYGEFDLNKLCRNYNKQFFKDLKNSRFCGFVEFLEDPANDILNFDQYYIKCNQECSL